MNHRAGILEKTMEQMDNIFTSSQFNRKAIKNGYPPQLIKHKGLSKFISQYATNEQEYSKTWEKIIDTREKALSNISNELAPQIFNDAQMITYLKSKGYKIMKPQSDWIEC